MLDEAEAEIAAGIGFDDDDLRKEDEEEYERYMSFCVKFPSFRHDC